MNAPITGRLPTPGLVLVLALGLLPACGVGTVVAIASSSGGGSSNAPPSMSGFEVLGSKLPSTARIHFVLADPEGDAASVEFFCQLPSSSRTTLSEGGWMRRRGAEGWDIGSAPHGRARLEDGTNGTAGRSQASHAFSAMGNPWGPGSLRRERRGKETGRRRDTRRMWSDPHPSCPKACDGDAAPGGAASTPPSASPPGSSHSGAREPRNARAVSGARSRTGSNR